VAGKLILSLQSQSKEVQTNQLHKFHVECHMVDKMEVKVEVTNLLHFHNMVIVEASEKEVIMMIIKTMITIQEKVVTKEVVVEITEEMILIEETGETREIIETKETIEIKDFKVKRKENEVEIEEISIDIEEMIMIKEMKEDDLTQEVPALHTTITKETKKDVTEEVLITEKDIMMVMPRKKE
jgi:hypothetical protein